MVQGTGRRAIALTTGVNLAITFVSAVTGALLARSMGPQIRGQFAAVTAWFWVALVVTELGQAAAVTYFVAKDPEGISATLTTSRRIMAVTGVITVVIGWFTVPLLAHGVADVVVGYRIMLISIVVTLMTTADVASLQVLAIPHWNVVRAAQPLLYLGGVVLLVAVDRVHLISACVVLAVTVGLQGMLAWTLRRRHIRGRVAFDRARSRQLLGYGTSQLVGSGPALVNTRLDQLILSQSARSATLGQYAVAVTVTSLVVPAVGAVGNVLFPRLAGGMAGSEAALLIRRSLLRTALVATAVALVLAGTGVWTVPLVFGNGFRPAVGLVWALTPAGIALALGQVSADILRGKGRPIAVARAQWGGAIATIVLLAALIPPFGAYGASVASGVAYSLTLLLLGHALWPTLRYREVRNA